MDDGKMHRIYQLMGLVAPDESFNGTRIAIDPLAILQRNTSNYIPSQEGATGIFLAKNDSSSQEKKLLQHK